MAEKSTEKKKANVFKKAFEAVKGFFKGLKGEVRKIAWPTKDTVAKHTVAVIIISAILCGFIRLIDVLAQLAIGAISSIF